MYITLVSAGLHGHAICDLPTEIFHPGLIEAIACMHHDIMTSSFRAVLSVKPEVPQIVRDACNGCWIAIILEFANA